MAKGCNLIVEALAGSGKTFTAMYGIQAIFGLLDQSIVPSREQQAVWDRLCEGRKPKNIRYNAFNKKIVTACDKDYAWLVRDLKQEGVDLEFKTIHATGYSILRKGLDDWVKPNGWRVKNIIQDMTGLTIRDIAQDRKYGPLFVTAVNQLVDLARVNLLPADTATYDYLIKHYDIEFDSVRNRDDVFQMATEILTEKLLDVEHEIDWTDMVWLPLALDLPVSKQDLVIVDEAQDLSPMQRELVLKTGHRFMFVGDKHQAIYGFAGADVTSIAKITDRLAESKRGVKILPLTTTRRCGYEIVKEAHGIVEHFRAHEDNHAGMVESATEATFDPQEGDMVLCRINAPLLGHVFKLIKEGRKATIVGRDLAQQFQNLIKKLSGKKVTTCEDLIEKVSDYYERIIDNLGDDDKAQYARMAIEDQQVCLLMVIGEAGTLKDIPALLKKAFVEESDPDAIAFSSIHRAKGLESSTVFILKPHLLPHPMAKSDWAKGQEMNLKYVGITRAIDRLVWVNED